MTREIELRSVKLSYPSLYKFALFEGRCTGKYESDFILDKQKHEKEINLINDAIDGLCKKIGTTRDKLGKKNCFKDGDNLTDKQGNPKSSPETDNSYILKARTKDRPILVNIDGKTPITEAEGLLVGGATVIVFISLFKYGAGENAGVSAVIHSVQLVDSSTRFGVEPFNPEGKIKPIGVEDIKNIFG